VAPVIDRTQTSAKSSRLISGSSWAQSPSSDWTLNSKSDWTHKAYVWSCMMYADVAVGSEVEEDQTQERVRSGWI
jgi:hypothetical protein